MSRLSSAGASRAEKKNCRYFSDIITLTHKALKKINADIGKPLEMTLMNREFELGDQKRGIYECGEDQQHPVNALETFMRDLRDLRLRRDLAELDDEEVALTQAQSEDSPPSPPPKSKKTSLQQLADAKQLKKVALFLLHCYVRVFMMQSKKDLAEPHTINTVSMIADSDMLRRAWQSEMDEDMKAFAAERGFKVRAKVLDESKSTLSKLFTPAELEKLSDRWEEIFSGDISFKGDLDQENERQSAKGRASSSSAAAKSRILEAIDRYNTSSDESSSESSGKDSESDSESEEEESPAPKRGKANIKKRARKEMEDSDLESIHSTQESKPPQPLRQRLQAKRDLLKADAKTGGSTAGDDNRLASRKKFVAPEYEELWEESDGSVNYFPVHPLPGMKRKHVNESSTATTTTTTTTAKVTITKKKNKKNRPKPEDSEDIEDSEPEKKKSLSHSIARGFGALSAASSSSSKSDDTVTLTMTREQWATIKKSVYDIIEVLSAIEKS